MNSHHRFETLQSIPVVANSMNIEPGSLLINPRDRAENLRTDESVGVIQVCIHQARDIHNICIYQNQDVYAKIYLTNDPETAVSTKTIDGGGKNPIFDETLKLNVKKIDDSSLKCEIWMGSRVRNYLEDQLLGFASLTLCEIVTWNGKLEREFSLSSSDVFHSPAGFVQLSLEYCGTSPELVEIHMPVQDFEVPESDSVPCELAKIEFPDPELDKENDCMVSEYIEISSMASQENVLDSSSSSRKAPESAENVISVIVPESKVIQEDIVDMYMKSMQEFTESMAKMKLPLDLENGNDGDSGERVRAVRSSVQNPRVFYGSRAFF